MLLVNDLLTYNDNGLMNVKKQYPEALDLVNMSSRRSHYYSRFTNVFFIETRLNVFPDVYYICD